MALGVDSAFAESNEEESIVAPRVVPRVDDDPVISTVLVSVSDDLHSMASEGTAAGVFVDSTLVGWEVLVHSEGSGHRAELDKILLNRVNRAEGVRRGSLV